MTSATVDWNTLVDEFEENQSVTSTKTVVELPPSPHSEEGSQATKDSCDDSVCSDVLDLYCEEDTDALSMDLYVAEKKTDYRYDEQAVVCNNNITKPARRQPRSRGGRRNQTGAHKMISSRVVEPRGPINARGRRRKRTSTLMREQIPLPAPPVERPSTTITTPGVDRAWTVRSVRSGYEDIVYHICNCNEAPNVVFAGLCYLQFDVYTMVLRNCNGKRRYWYDRPSRNRQLPNGSRVDDFERAMVWRANSIGRASTSPGYDLAAFVLQNVATDKRSDGNSRAVGPPPLIIVTSDNMLTDPSMGNQLLFADKRKQARNQLQPKQIACLVCGNPSGIVTQDNASVATFTCWRHSNSYLADSSATWTRVCDTVIVDMEFLRDDTNGELVCRLRLVGTGNAQPLTIAEIVTQTFGMQRTMTVTDTDSTTAHSFCCADRHRNDEDLFPSMPVTGGGRVRYYDTTIGSLVDKMYCMVSTFQRV